MTIVRQTRRHGWLTEQVVRSGLKERWAAERLGDRLSVTLGYEDGGFVVTTTVFPASGGRLTRVTDPTDIQTARAAFRNATARLIRGRYPKERDKMSTISIKQLAAEYSIQEHEVLTSLDLEDGATEADESFARKVLDLLAEQAVERE